MNSKDRLKHWENLPNPKPSWEDWKRLLGASKQDTAKAWERWIKIINKRLQDNLGSRKKK